MNCRRRKCLQKYFGFVILLVNINFVLSTLNTSDQFDLKSISFKISEKFKTATYIELGITSMQKIYDSYKFTTLVHNEEQIVDKIALKLKTKLTRAFHILYDIQMELEKCQMFHSTELQSQIHLISHNDFHTGNGSDYLARLFEERSTNVTDVGARQIYFLSAYDLHRKTNYVKPNYGDYDDTYIWQLYSSLLNTKPNNIFIAINLGNMLNEKSLNLIKTFAKQIINTLRSVDRLGVIAFGHSWSSPYVNDYTTCQTTGPSTLTTDECLLVNATVQNKYIFNRFIDSLTQYNGLVDQEIVFEQLLNTVQLNSNGIYEEKVSLIYLSVEPDVSQNKTANVLRIISDKLTTLNKFVFIHTVSIFNGSEFMRDIAEQNFHKYRIAQDHLNRFIGVSHTIRNTAAFGMIIARIFNTMKDDDYGDGISLKEPDISFPVWQQTNKNLIVSLYVPCDKSASFGLLAMDLYFDNIAEDITYFGSQMKYSYAFLLYKNGATLMHSLFPRPSVIRVQPKFVDIIHLEQSVNFSTVYNLILNQEKGSYEIIDQGETLKYVWQRVLRWYIVCIVVRNGKTTPKRIQRISFADTSSNNLIHHRLDLLPPMTLCRHLNQVSTLDAGTLYLSASCFQSPFSYLNEETTTSLTIQSYMAYLKDETRLLANPGLKEEVRNDVVVISHILDYLMQQHLHGSLYKYIVRRYIATLNGVMQIYPGTMINSDVEPTRRNWFVRALEHPGKVVFTSPYLDTGGAGYVVTISHTIFEGKGNLSAQHTSDDNIVAVMAMDITLGYIYKILIDTVPYCSPQDGVKCFLIDDNGYLIYHPNLIDPNGKGPVEQQHIIHKESLVANDLLNHKEFVKKSLCNNYADGTIQRYYKFNTSLTSVLSNVIHGGHCVKYYITVIPETNAFIGIVNSTCNDVATFCPCSTVDRLCLICNRMEENECECPCECPLSFIKDSYVTNTSQCTTQMVDDQLSNPLCAIMIENAPFTTSNVYHQNSVTLGLKQCFPQMCEYHTTYESCVGLLGCEWCHLDTDGDTELINPFCTSLTTCFHGILGSVSPYRDLHLNSISSNDLFMSTYSSIGPAAGSIVALCFIVALMLYCYRQYSLHFMERLYPNSNQSRSQRIQMSSIDGENFNDDATTNHQDKLLANFPTNDIGPLSPYCVTTEYRKPSAAVDSDLGYSTMTPHEESERLSFALIELDLLDEGDFNQLPLGKINEPGTTCLPNNKHFILAPVTVHRNMETL